MGMRSLNYWTLLACTALAPLSQSPSPQVAREQTADQQVRHVLNRLAFGARPGDYDKVRRTGVDTWINQQLAPERIPDPEVERMISRLPTYTMSPAKLIEDYPRVNPAMLARARTAADTQMLRQQGSERREMITELRAARVGRAVASERQLEEVLTDFWLNHFSVYVQKNQQMIYYLGSYEREVIRPHVFGKFRDLLEAVAKSPAMLIYLDNQQSQADTSRVTMTDYGLQGNNAMRGGQGGFGRGRGVARGRAGFQQPPQRRATGLNENYARELLELHTLGVDGGYTQQDVIEVARALTGWSIVPPAANGRNLGRVEGVVIEGSFMFRPQVHDAEPKTVLGVKLKGGRGIEDGEQVLDIVSRHPSTAKFIARQLATRFVSDSPPPELVNRAADVFRKTNGDLREVVRTIITSPEFFSSAAYRAKVKSPFEVVVSAVRAVGAPVDLTPRTAQIIESLGQPIFGRQTPDGWPETGEEWINTGAILNRINFGIALAAGRVPGSNQNQWPLATDVRNKPREAQVDAVITAFLGGEASTETRSILLQGNNPLLEADSGGAATAGASAASNTMSGNDMVDRGRGRGGAGRIFGPLPALEGVPLLVGLALGSPEFQRR